MKYCLINTSRFWLSFSGFLISSSLMAIPLLKVRSNIRNTFAPYHRQARYSLNAHMVESKAFIESIRKINSRRGEQLFSTENKTGFQARGISSQDKKKQSLGQNYSEFFVDALDDGQALRNPLVRRYLQELLCLDGDSPIASSQVEGILASYEAKNESESKKFSDRYHFSEERPLLFKKFTEQLIFDESDGEDHGSSHLTRDQAFQRFFIERADPIVRLKALKHALGQDLESGPTLSVRDVLRHALLSNFSRKPFLIRSADIADFAPIMESFQNAIDLSIVGGLLFSINEDDGHAELTRECSSEEEMSLARALAPTLKMLNSIEVMWLLSDILEERPMHINNCRLKLALLQGLGPEEIYSRYFSDFFDRGETTLLIESVSDYMTSMSFEKAGPWLELLLEIRKASGVDASVSTLVLSELVRSHDRLGDWRQKELIDAFFLSSGFKDRQRRILDPRSHAFLRQIIANLRYSHDTILIESTFKVFLED